MARLIAQELAVRERELVQLKPEDIKRAQQWIGTDTIKPESPPTSSKKSVSFSNPDEEPNPMNEFMNGENFEETESILSKFKMISEPLPEPSANANALQQVYAKLLELEQRINANHDEIMACFKQM